MGQSSLLITQREPMLTPLSTQKHPLHRKQVWGLSAPLLSPLVPYCDKLVCPSSLAPPSPWHSLFLCQGEGTAGILWVHRSWSLWSGAGGTATGFLSMDSNPWTGRGICHLYILQQCCKLLFSISLNQSRSCSVQGVLKILPYIFSVFSMPICCPAQKRPLSQHPLQMIRQWANTTSTATVTCGEEINPSGPTWLLWCARIYGP